jgi:hypothetical protein
MTLPFLPVPRTVGGPPDGGIPPPGGLGEVRDQRQQLLAPVAVLPCQLDELARVAMDGTLLWRAADRHPAPAAELEQPFVAQGAQRPQDGVAVDAEDCREVDGRRQPLAGLSLTLGDRAANLPGHLPVKVGGVASADLDAEQWC